MRTKIIRRISNQAGRFCSINRLLKIRKPVFLPFYHVVSNDNLPHILNYNYRNAVSFEKELDFYLKHFKPVGLKELYDGNYSENAFHLSFDDGLRECYDVIAPVLLRKGVPATFFINAGFVDNKALFHKYRASLVINTLKKLPAGKQNKITQGKSINTGEFLQITVLNENVIDDLAGKLEIDFDNFLAVQKPYLTTSQIHKLTENGFGIGAHSYSHPEFWRIATEKQIEEVRKSFEWLGTAIRPEIRSFAFPFTDSGVPKEVFDAMYNDFGCGISFGTAGIKYDSFPGHFQRYPVEHAGNFLQNLKGELVYLELRKLIGKATVKH